MNKIEAMPTAAQLSSRRGSGVSLFKVGVVGLVSASVLAACVSIPESPASGVAPASLEQRAVERWELMIGGDYNAAYQYATPGYRQAYSAQDFLEKVYRAPIKWQSAEFMDMDCPQEGLCDVTMRVHYSINMPGAGSVGSMTTVEESWLLIDGVWYFLPSST